MSGIIRWCLLAGFIVLPAAAQAQVTSVVRTTSFDGALSFNIIHPTLSSDSKFINCAYPQPGCVPFNLAACDPNNQTRIQLVVSRGSAPSAASIISSGTQVNAYAWVQNSSGTCSNQPGLYGVDPNSVDPNSTVAGTIYQIGSNNGISRLPINSSSQFAGGSTALAIPDDFSVLGEDGSVGELFMSDIMNGFPGLCSGAGTNFTMYKLCIGIKVTGGVYINGSNSVATTTTTTTTGLGTATPTSDITGFFQFPVDTLPPLAPTGITSKSMVGQVVISLDFPGGSEDIYGVRVRYTTDPNDIALTTADPTVYGYNAAIYGANPNATCANWAHASTTDLVAVSLSDSTASVSVDGTNGQQYAYCGQTIDFVGNESTWSSAINDYPHPECDLFDCWPTNVPIDVGYCGAAAAPLWLATLGGCALLRRMRRRGRR